MARDPLLTTLLDLDAILDATLPVNPVCKGLLYDGPEHGHCLTVRLRADARFKAALNTLGWTLSAGLNGSPPTRMQVSSSSPLVSASSGTRSGALTDLKSGVRPLYTEKAIGRYRSNFHCNR